MLDVFSSQIQGKLDDLGRKKNLTEEDLRVSLREIRLVLLEADVNYKVAKNFCKRVEERAKEEEILNGLDAGEQVIKVVRDEMVALLEGDNSISFDRNNIMMMVGLQGSGKTTSTGKIANFLRKKKLKNKPLLVACDVYRPAAIQQLQTLGKQLGIEVYAEDSKDVLQIAANAVAYAKENKHDLVIFDTACRMHVDTAMMEEIKALQETYNPSETLLVIDGSIGQLAVDIAAEFGNYVNVSGLVFTKMDSDTRGGAVFSVKEVTGIDIKFLGISEKMDGLEEFNPDRVVGRILGQGDVLGLIEKAEMFAEDNDTTAMAEKMLEGKFDLNDFLKQMKMISKMGGIASLMSMLPGVGKKFDSSMIDEKQVKRTQAIIESMTEAERTNPKILNASRRKRIAEGSGTRVQDVNKLIKGYEDSKKMMKQMKNMDMNKINNMFK